MPLFLGMAEGLLPPCQRVINEYPTESERLVNSLQKSAN